MFEATYRLLEHGQIQCMPPREGDELKAIAERGQFFAPALHRGGVELGLQVE